MTDNLSRRNRFSGMTLPAVPAILQRMAEIDRVGLGRRLRAIMAHLEIGTVREFAEAMGVERGVVSNWINAATSGNPPPVPYMLRLLELERDLTLDWIYTGNPARLPTSLSIKLTALVDGMVVPDSHPDPEVPARPSPVSASARRRRVQQAT